MTCDIGHSLCQAKQHGRKITFHIIPATVKHLITKELTQNLETKLRFSPSSGLSRKTQAVLFCLRHHATCRPDYSYGISTKRKSGCETCYSVDTWPMCVILDFMYDFERDCLNVIKLHLTWCLRQWQSICRAELPDMKQNTKSNESLREFTDCLHASPEPWLGFHSFFSCFVTRIHLLAYFISFSSLSFTPYFHRVVVACTWLCWFRCLSYITSSINNFLSSGAVTKDCTRDPSHS